MKKCPRCSSELSLTDKACPKCGLLVSQMAEVQKRFNLSAGETNEETFDLKLSKKEEKLKKKEEKKNAKQAKKAEKKKQKEVDEIDFSQYAINSDAPDPDEILETDTFTEKRKKKKKAQAKPKFLIDENGEFVINTDDVEIVGEETGKIIEKQYEQSYSVKKSRGDYIPPKIKWWEIYKVADRHFARSKIKKEVNKASKIKPNYVKKSTLLLLAIFLGWMGAHNFYARNKRKGWLSVILLIIWIGVVSLSMTSPFFASISTSIGGGAGFLCLLIWVSDIISIISNTFKYKFQRDRFIEGLNVETRAKLGKKYIDMDLYHKPLWYRFKVWCGEVRRNSEIRKRERRQQRIEREKRRQAEMAEQEKIDREIAEFEEKENNELNKNSKNNDVSDIVSGRTLEELKSFGDDSHILDGNADDSDDEDADDDSGETETENSARKNIGSSVQRKYSKTVKNKKAEKKKKKK